MRKNQHCPFNYVHDDTWTKENLTHGTWNIFYENYFLIEMLISTFHYDYLI